VSETLPPTWPPSGDVPEPEQEGPREPTVLDRVAANRGVRLAVLIAGLGYLAYASLWAFAIVMALAFCIFMHELGHYLVAKRAGMKVTEFFIGFGPRIWSFQRGETEYGIKLIWLGAYVKIIGMSNLEDVSPEDEARSYRSKSFSKRMPVVLAGPAMNLALGFLILLIGLVAFGRPSETRWDVKAVTVGSAAEQAGIQPGDEIVAFDGQDVSDFDSLTSLVKAHAGMPVELTVVRDGERVVVPTTLGWSLLAESAGPLGLVSSDRVTEVDGVTVNTYADLVGALKNAEGPTTLTYTRGKQTGTVEVQGPIDLPGDAYKGFLGVGPGTVYESVALTGSVGEAGSQFGTIVVQSVQGMGRLFSPSGIGNLFNQVADAAGDTAGTSTSPSNGSSSGSGASTGSTSADAERPLSVVGIVNVGGQIGEQVGWAGVFTLLALVNIFLGLINLVPLLPFDGGHIVVACYEEIRSRMSHTVYRVNAARLLPVTYVVLLLIVGIGLSTVFLDIVRPINLN
jgi:RIP metalloprotease RseP